MKVVDLQQHLADLARLLEASGAKAVAADLAAVRDGLKPFAEHSLKGFADFLIRAEAFSRGEAPVTSAGARRPSSRKAVAPKPPAADVEALCRDTKSLYERATDPSFQRDQLDGLTARIAGLKKADLVRVSEALGMVGMKAKTNEMIVAAVRDRILGRRGGTLRAGLTDRPEPGHGPVIIVPTEKSPGP